MKLAYRVELEPDDNGTLLVTCPALPGVVTFGRDRADALDHARDAIEEWLAGLIDENQDIPFAPAADLRKNDGLTVRLPLLTALKVQLYLSLRAAGITRAELARRLDWHRESVDRLFRLDHASRVDQMEAAFRALGRDIDFDTSKAA